MSSKSNIVRIIRMLIIVLSTTLLLTACFTSTSDDNKNTATSGDAGEADTFQAQQIDCWQKEIVESLYDIMSKTTSQMYSKLTEGAFSFMLVAFAIWLAVRLLAHVSSFTEENPAEVWTEIFRKALLCFTCGLIASNPQFLIGILNLTVFPVYGAFLEFGSQILAAASSQTYTVASHVPGALQNVTQGDLMIVGGTMVGGSSGGIAAAATAQATGASDVKLFGETITWFSSGQPVVCSVGAMDKATVDGFPEMPKKMMSCLICALNQRMNLGFALSFKIMGAPGITPLLIGIFILLCFTIVKIGFVFYLVDTIFKFTVMIVIMPLLVMGYAFQYTRSWLGKGLMTILNSAAFMMFIAVVMAMAMSAVEVLITNNQDIFNPPGDLQKSFSEFSVPFVCLLLIAFLIASSIGVAQQLTDSLVGGSSKSEFNKKVQSVLKLVVSGILALVTAGGSYAAQKSATIAKMAAKAQKVRDKASQVKQKVNKFAGRG